MGKVIIFSAPSGAGKSTIVNYLLEKGLGLEFSISATCRAPRGKEIHGKEYYFFTADVRGVYRIVHKKLERKCERKACKYKEFERFEGDLGKKNEMYTGLICFNLV